jgi:hypothetical protein
MATNKGEMLIDKKVFVDAAVVVLLLLCCCAVVMLLASPD